MLSLKHIIYCQKQLPAVLIKSQFSNKNIVWPKKIVSGIQPTGAVHLGNYLGAIRPWISLQETCENVSYFIADLHSITLPQDIQNLKENTLAMTATLLACGINPNKSTLFLQSAIHQHTELCWILNCLTTMARLSHLPQYKEKSKQLKEIPLGLFVYPVLQAADVMIHKGTHVPCGEDQTQQIQLIQHLAHIFNNKYGETFPICHGIIANDSSSKIKSLRDPTKKMSKSEKDPKSCILLTDSSEQILEKCKKSLTDFISAVQYDPEKRLGVSNLIIIHSLIADKTPQEICDDSIGIDTGMYKLRVADCLIEYIKPIRKKIDDYRKHPDYLFQILNDGSEKAREIAEKTMLEVFGKVGIGCNDNLIRNTLIRKKM